MTTPYFINPDLLAQTSALGYSVDASTAGLKPGQWPELLELPAVGNNRPFKRISLSEERAVYIQEFGALKITIWNT